VIIIPVVLIIVLGALDFGRAFLGWVVLNNAARVGANYAALHPDAWGNPGIAYQQAEYTSLVTDARNDAGIALAGCESVAVSQPSFPGGTDLGDFAVVQLDCEFDPITPLMGEVLTGLTGGKVAVGARSVFPIRQDGVAVAPPSSAPSCISTIGDITINGMDVQFNDATAGGPNWWFWVVEGPTAYVLQNPSHTYTTPGDHTITLDTRVGGVDCNQDQRTINVQPTPSPDPSATPDPSASPSPSATPVPNPTCTVPGLVGERKNAAQGLWDAAGFTTTVGIVAGANPNANWFIEYQSLNSGNDIACNVDIEIGPDPLATPTP
jgi:hypothetical protein